MMSDARARTEDRSTELPGDSNRQLVESSLNFSFATDSREAGETEVE